MNQKHKTENTPCFEQLRNVLAKYGVTDESESARLIELCTSREFAKDELLHQAGDIADRVFFICSGLVRLYYITEEGKDHNKSFAVENQFVGALQYSEHPEPGRFYIQAIVSTNTLAISLEGLNTLYRQSIQWANLGRLYMEALAVKKAKREAEFLLDSAEERYQHFLQEEPELVKRLPLYHIASYLGITDVALSRIRRRLAK